MDLFEYDQLTWPEVADLARDTPLLLPVGAEIMPEHLQRLLGTPPRIGVLPPFPYGWAGSALEVRGETLQNYLENLIQSLRDDGFTSVHTVVGGGSDAGVPKGLGLTLRSPANPPRPPLPPNGALGKVILIPIGHTEQHGLHLPLSVDTIIIEAIAKGTEKAAPDLCYSLPVMPYGVSTHRTSFPATLDAGGRAFEDFWLSVVDELVERGFDRFYFLSGHGGNMSFLVNVVKYAGERHRRVFCATAYLHTSGPIGAAAIERLRTSKIGGMGHAGELETSFMLHLRPDLCHMERVVDETDFISTSSYYMDWIEGGALVANPPWDDDTLTGAYGAGSQATAEKGRLWLAAAIEEKVVHVREIHEQQTRREMRRKSGYGLWGKSRK